MSIARYGLNSQGVFVSMTNGGFVSYQDYAKLAAENAGLKKFCKDAVFDADYEAELGMERGGFTDALNDIKTPATDAFLSEVRAQGVEMFSRETEKLEWHESTVRFVLKFADQLRKGVQP